MTGTWRSGFVMQMGMRGACFDDVIFAGIRVKMNDMGFAMVYPDNGVTDLLTK